MDTSRMYRVVVLLVIGVLCIGGLWRAPVAPSVAAAAPGVRRLGIDQTDAAAHAAGGSWHDTSNTPYVVDFGAPDPNAPVAGMDQWLVSQGQSVSPRANVSGTKKYLVLRVYFDGEANDSYYAKNAADEDSDSPWNVNDDLMQPLQDLYKLTSYNKVTIDWDISNLYGLPYNRDHYIDTSTGNSSGACVEWRDGECRLRQFGALINDATELAKNDFDYNDYAGILVLMSDIGSSAAFHRAAAGVCNTKYYGYDLPGVATNHNYGCIVALENHAAYSDTSNEKNRIRQELYGRLGHEFGHAFQQAGPAHPSNYDNPFELMDSNYPGHVGAYEKQASVAFPGWLPPSQYIQVSKTAKTQNDSTCLRAIEYDPALSPVPQALKVSITGSLYYMLSVRVKNDGTTGNGDHLNAHFASGGDPSGIPSEGMLIERVNEGASGEDGDPIVTVKGKGGDIDKLWQKGDVVDFFSSDGVKFTILPQAVNNPDKLTMCVRISFDATNSLQPDVSMRPWREAPGETWETTDIWFDSPLNGYGTYRYGSWNDINNVPAPRYNGDIPASGSVNRVYARVRNVGTKVATNITVRFQVTDPAGMGINNSTSWTGLGDGVNAGTSDGVVNSTRFPALASLAPGAYTDVYVEWKPEFTDAPTTGTFDYHTCVRVKIDTVADEKVTGNQDGNDEQENIFTFEATPAVSPIYQHDFTIFNESLTNPITYYLKLDSTLPPNWDISINGGSELVTLAPNERLTVPVIITPTGSAVVGSIFEAKIAAEKHFDLTNDLALAINPNNPEAKHAGMLDVGGVSFAVNVLAPTTVRCEAYARGSYVEVIGSLDGFEGIHQAGTPLRAYAQAYDVSGNVISLDDRANADIGANGVFRIRFSTRGEQSPTVGGAVVPKSVRCVFPGTHLLASSATGLVNLQNAVPPTPTSVPWWGSEFHSTLNLNQVLAPPSTYSDTVNGVTGNQYTCPAGRCPVLVGGRRGRGAGMIDINSTLLKSNNNIALGSSFSVGLWAKRDNNNIAETLLSHGDTVATGKMFNMGFSSDGRFVCSTYNDELFSPATYNDTSWHHYVCVVDGSARTLYVDDNAVATMTSVQPPYNITNKIGIGRRADAPNSFGGVIDEVRIYTWPIDASVVSELYANNPIAVTPSFALSFDDISIVESEGMAGNILASCGGLICPVVYYPDRSVLPRPLERVAAQQLEPRHWMTWTSTNPVVAGNMGSLMFWAHLDDTSSIMLPLVQHSVANRPQLFWRGTTHELTFNSLTYDWSANYTSGWHMFTFVMNGAVLQMYIDGDKVAEGPATPGAAPFRVGLGSSLRVGGLSGGEIAAVELANWAFPSTYIAQRYTGNMEANYVTPSRTLTITPTPTKTTQPMITVPIINVNKTMTAVAATQNAVKTLEAVPYATATKKAQLMLPTFALMQTQWANTDRTETAYAIRTPIPTRRPALTLIPTGLPTLTYFIFPTRNALFTSTRTATASMTATLMPSFTASATASETSTATPVLPTRTRFDTPTFQSTLTPSPTKSLTPSKTSLTAPTASITPNLQFTMTASRTATRTATASATATPGRFGRDMKPITQLPTGMLYRALQHIFDSRGIVAPDWDSAFVGDIAVPFYRPDICGGEVPAYYEISVFKDAARTIPAGFLMMTAPCTTDVPHDVPIAHWDSKGSAISTQISMGGTGGEDRISTDGLSEYKLWKLDTLSYVAEQNGVIKRKLGQFPALISGLTSYEFSLYSSPQNALTDVKWAPLNQSTGDDNFKVDRVPAPIVNGVSPEVARSLWQFVDWDVTNNFAGYLRQYPESFGPLIADLKREVAGIWGYENKITSPDNRLCGNGCNQYHLPVAAGLSSKVVIPIKGITIKDIVNYTPNTSASQLAYALDTATYGGYPVLTITGGTLPAGTLPRLTLKITPPLSLVSFEPVSFFTFYLVENPAGSVRAERSWSSWTYYWAGTATDQRNYAQWTVGGCAVGCGPVAWMMLLGWVDVKSTYPQVTGQVWKRWNAYRENGSGTGNATTGAGIAPQATVTSSNVYMAPGVFTSTEYIRNQVGTFCLAGSGATYPSSMDGIRNYLNYVGTGMSFDTHYNAVGYHEDRLRDYAIEHLTKSNPSDRRPVIIGIGLFNHYPLAYGYSWRSRPTNWRDAGWWVGDDVVYSRYFYVNNGHGGSDNGWVDAGTWFAGRVSP